MTDEKLIALTFDDGPNLSATPLVLDKLEKHGIVGSFFIIADSVTAESVEQMKRAHAMGCEICNHSKTHSFMDKLSAEEIRSEIEYTSDLIEKTVGYRPRFFRPPYIAVNQTLFDNVGLPFICGKGCNDWELDVPADYREKTVLAQSEDGDIVLLHDMENNFNTVEALDGIIDGLKERGFRFVTVSELFEKKGVEPVCDGTPVIYSNVLSPYRPSF